MLFHDLADGALLVEYPGLSDDEANAAAVSSARVLQQREPEGLLGEIVGARTLFLEFDPAQISADRFRTLLAEKTRADRQASRRTLRIPVAYGGEAGTDLPALAREAGLTQEEFARRHAAAVYRVAFLGFAPGFAYLTGLPGELRSPRLATPRPRVAAGTVAVAGPYTGIYPGETPGGWRLIGRADVRLFDRNADPPTLFRMGDEIRFEPVEQIGSSSSFDRATELASEPSRGSHLFRIVSAGVFSSVQGAPRYGWSCYGVPPGGAMDWSALARANELLGNPLKSAALEMTLVGAELEALHDATVCLAGAESDADCNGRAVALEQRIDVRRGDRLRVGRIRGGARTYLAVEGGLAPPARFEISKRLASGDLIAGDPVPPALRPLRSKSRPVRDEGAEETEATVVRVVLDPREVPFSREGIATFLSSTYRISASSDRRGMRLDGESISLSRAADIPPEGTPLAGIQVARDGMPIVLGPDRPVTGGYARIATVIHTDFPLLAQTPPGAAVRFVAVQLADALAARVG